MDKNFAVVDIGTLKVKFLVAAVSTHGEIIEKYSSNNLTCFGCEMDQNNGNVLDKFLGKTITELKRCKKIINKYQVFKFKVVSTHALRRAKNKQAILKRIKSETGFTVENISQRHEAELFFKAVMKDFSQSEGDFCLVDVGGGSVQVLIGNNQKLEKIHMMQTGAQYLHNNFTQNSTFATSYTTLKEIEKMKSYILENLLPLPKNIGAPIIYGSSNIIDLMKTIKLPLKPIENTKAHPYKTYAKYLDNFIKKMLPLNYSQREALFNFQKGYMWGIDKAFLNISLLAKHLNSPFIIPSNANIAQGLILSISQS